MQRWKNIFFNVLLSLNFLLIFFVLMVNKLVVPSWLQVAGRMHPLVLHFPIVLLLLYIVWSIIFFSKKKTDTTIKSIGEWLLLAGALSAVTTAIMGLLLSKEPGYNPDALWWHKWSGIGISIISFMWYAARNKVCKIKYVPQFLAAVFLGLIIFTGHEGAGITHGEDFLLAPVTFAKVKAIVAIEDAAVFADMVQPILQAKCMSCHNEKKAKGQLVMENESGLLKGGKHGILWQADAPLLGLLMQRIHLGEEDKKHMPPLGKPQLDDEEKQIIFQWIKAGADFKVKVNKLKATDSLSILAAKLFTTPDEVYTFAAASEKEIEKLNNTNLLIHPIAEGSPALAVNFYNKQNFTSANLKDLLVLKNQIISLDLAYMPINEADISSIVQFKNLRKLNLNFTSVPGKSLVLLKQLPFLNHLSLTGTQVTKKELEPLLSFPKLAAIFIWNTPILSTEIIALKKVNPAIKLEAGFMNDSLILKLTPPILENEERIINAPLALHLKHFIKGVIIRYTLDGSNPDSAASPIYDGKTIIDKYTKLKAKAYKPGWLSSDSITAIFYKNTFKADSILSLLPLDSVYKGTGAKTLINGEKGDFNFRSGQWLGFRSSKMNMLLSYVAPVNVSSVTLSALIDIGSSLMPPVEIEIWGGMDTKKLVLLGKIKPAQPDKLMPAYMMAYDINFTAHSLKFIKVVVVPVAKLPIWHSSKSQKGWVFFDQIFVN